MRVLIVSDIHGNFPALAAIPEAFDACLFLGDAVDYGVEPGPVVGWLREHMTHGVRGNHDHGAAQHVTLQGAGGFRYLTSVTRPLTIERLTAGDRRFLGALPTTKAITLFGKRTVLVHATPRDPLEEYATPDVDFWARRLDGLDADYVFAGHTHTPYILRVGDTTVVNPGSVGLPRDGDPRGSYAVLTADGPALKRFEYPVEEAVARVQESPLPDAAKALLAEALRTGRLAPRNGKPAGVQSEEGPAVPPASSSP